MTKPVHLFSLFLTVFWFISCQAQRQHISTETKENEASMNAFIDQLMATMTLEDKIGEMTQLTLDVISAGEPFKLHEPHRLDHEKLNRILVDLRVGSILNVGGHAYDREHWEEIITTIQDYAQNKKQSGIPVLYGIDAIHGTSYTSNATLFPQQLGQAATWNPQVAAACGTVTAYETRASGIPWSFAPVLDIGRDPRWPRLWETYGEDVYLASRMGEHFIAGMQGDNMSDPYRMGVCLKHFLGYSVTQRGKDRTPAWIPERQLREYFLPTFQAGIEAGAKSIMVCSGEMNGIPVHANKKILTDLLRHELSFDGLLVTDWKDIIYLYKHHRVAKNFKDAIRIAINAGIDMAMVPVDVDFVYKLRELVEEGEVPMSRIDESTKRILQFKYELGLFDQAYYPFDQYPDFASAKHESLALNAAEESIILAKNENFILPLPKESKLAVIGPNAHSLNVLNGGWTGTWQGNDPVYNTPGKRTILEAIQAKLGSDQVVYLTEVDEAEIMSCDVVVACVGEQPYCEKPGDMNDLDLDAEQIAMVEKCAQMGKPVILIVVAGRPRIIREIEPLAEAILVGFLPGNEGGSALANILFGDTNPSGKMPLTYPKYSNDLFTYDHKGMDIMRSDFEVGEIHPQFEFGHGLSYTTFEYSNLEITGDWESAADLDVRVQIKNTGERAGKEVVQLYVTDLVASITPSVKRLRGFSKIHLEPGEEVTVSFQISKRDLSFVGIDNTWIYEPGEFIFQIGKLSKSKTLN